MNPTAESIEAESALIRSQLVAVGADIRHRADPTIIVDAAKSTIKRQTEFVPTVLKNNASRISMVLLGSALGAVVTGLLSPSRGAPSVAPKASDSKSFGGGSARPPVKLQAKAALLSTLAVGLGYVAGAFVPDSPTEDRLFGPAKVMLREGLDLFLQEHLRGMKFAVADLFGASRLSAAVLIGLAMVAEALGPSQRPSKPNSP